jgi:hypothetical protein
MQSDSNMILVGIKISDKLRDRLDTSKYSAKPFFADNDPEFLQVLQINSEDYIAKITKSGASLEDLNNMCINLKTMLKMICPNFFIAGNAIKIIALSPMRSRSFHYGMV